MKFPPLFQRFVFTAVASIVLSLPQLSSGHVPHDIIYSLGVSPDYAEDGLVFSSSTQFGESHLVSHNRGETFAESNTGMTRAIVTGHVFSPQFKRDGTVYLITRIGYYKSTDRGANWVKQSVLPNQTILALALASDHAKSGDHYLLTKTGLFAVSGDGDHEEITRQDEIQLGKLEIIDDTLYVHRVVHPEPEKKKGMEVVDYTSGQIDCYDLIEKTWSPLSDTFKAKTITDFDITSVGDRHVVVVTLKDGSIHLSKDSGATWKESLRRKVDFACKVAFSPQYERDGTIAAAMAKGFVFLSKDEGKSWEATANGLSRWVHHVNIHVNHLKFSPDYANDKTIFLGKTTGLYKTTDSGEFWRHVNVWNPKWGYFVYPAPNKGSGDVFTATYNSGISRSSDSGDSWQSANLGINAAFANSMELSPNYENDRTIFVVDIVKGLYRSVDGGRSWAAETEFNISEHYDQPVLFRQFGVSPNYEKNGLMFFFTVPRKVLGKTEKQVWKYNDHTKELKQVPVGAKTPYINDFAFSPPGAEKEQIFIASSSGFFVSNDLGESWEPKRRGAFDKILISPDFNADGLIYLMGTDGTVEVSHNGGKEFESAPFDLSGQPVENLTFSPSFSRDNTLYAATYGEGVYRSIDRGRTWAPFALRGKLLYTGLAFSADYETDKTIYAPAIDGIYRSQDGGRTWEEVLNQFQFLPKVPLVTLRSPEGHEMPLGLDLNQIKQYDGYDPEISPEIHRVDRKRISKVESDKAYLASYYEFSGEAGYAIEVYFYGDSIEYQCVTGPDFGIVDIYLDAEKQGSFDLYSAEETFDVTGFRKEGIETAFHTLRIVATGKKNPESHGLRMNYNAAIIGGSYSSSVSKPKAATKSEKMAKPISQRGGANQPNVIVVMADDISARDFPIYGSKARGTDEWAKTPVIDKLATEGCFLTTAWSSTVCMPTRAMLMSGRYAHLTKWWDNGQFGRAKAGGVLQVPDSSPLGIGQIAQKAGYRSIWVGKTHVTFGSSHTRFGFDQGVFTPGEPGVRGESPHQHFLNIKDPDFWNYHSYFWWPEVMVANDPAHPDKAISWTKTEMSDYGPDIELEKIFAFMEQSQEEEKPFLVYHTSHLGHQAIDMMDPKFPMTWPGTPGITWDEGTESYTRHEPKITASGAPNTKGATYELENITANTLKSHIEYLDYQLWQYLNQLEKMGELDNTIVIFTADNGTKGWKASVKKQRGIHVPFVVYAPGEKALVSGEQDIISDLTDLLPTLAEMMGVPLPPESEYELNGTSLWPYLTGKSDQHRKWIYAFKGPSQMARGEHLLRDGNGDWYDVRKSPANLDNFPKIEDFDSLSEVQAKEKKMIETVLARFAREDIGGPNSFHEDASMKISERELEKMKKKAESLRRHLEKLGE